MELVFVQDVATEEGRNESLDFPMDDGRVASSNGADGANEAASNSVYGDVKPDVAALSSSTNVSGEGRPSGEGMVAHKGSVSGNEAEKSGLGGADGDSRSGNEAERSGRSGTDRSSGVGAEDAYLSGIGSGVDEGDRIGSQKESGSESLNESGSGSEFSEEILEPWKVEGILDLDHDSTIPASDCGFGAHGDADDDDDDEDTNDADTNGENNVLHDDDDSYDAENENSEYETISGNVAVTREDGPESGSVPSGGFWTWMTRRIKDV